MKKDLIILVIVMIGLFGLGSYFLFAPKAPELTYQPVDVGGGSITVEDQEDLNVVVLDAELTAPGWITIHESLSQAPATIVGVSQYLEAGVYKDLSIPLTTQMSLGYKYITLLHVDNGDKQFVAEDDFPVKVNEVVVRPDFVAIGESVDSGESIIDIPGTNDSLIVDVDQK